MKKKLKIYGIFRLPHQQICACNGEKEMIWLTCTYLLIQCETPQSHLTLVLINCLVGGFSAGLNCSSNLEVKGSSFGFCCLDR
jgi:hypothetical protein